VDRYSFENKRRFLYELFSANVWLPSQPVIDVMDGMASIITCDRCNNAMVSPGRNSKGKF
jgi:hypothetical protein